MQSPETSFPPVVQTWQEMVWVALTAIMFLAWWAYFARTQARRFSLAERILAAFIATVGQILATTFILGWAHQLSWWPLGIVNAAFTLILLVRADLGRGGRDLHSEIGLTVAAIWRSARSSSAVWAIGVVALFAAGWVIYLGQLLPPFSYDAWGYHFGWAGFAHQEGHLGPFNIPNPHINNFPKNADILFLWWVIGAGTERWANIVQAPFALASAFACYLLARRVGAGRTDAAIVGLLVFSVPTVVHMMWKGMVDLAAMGGALASLAFLSRRRLTPAALAVAGCAAGFTVGTKGSAIYFFAALLLLLVYRLLPLGMDAFRGRPRLRLRGIVGALVLFGVISFAFGSYFYLRNWVLEGNPTGLYEVKIGEVVLFEGPRDVGEIHFSRRLMPDVLWDALEEGPEWPIVLDGFFDPQEMFFQGNRIGGWGSVWTVLMFPAVPIALLWAILRRRWAVVAIILACVLPFFLFKYNHTWTRYHLPLIGAGTTAFAYLLTVLKRTRYRRLLLAVATASMVATTFIALPHHFLEPDTIAQAREKPYLHSDRYIYFNSWGDHPFARALQHVQAPGTTLAFSNVLPLGKILALWNPTYTNRAVWVPWRGDGEGWEIELRREGADAVYVAAESKPMEHADAHAETFVLLYEGRLGGVYRLAPPEDSTEPPAEAEEDIGAGEDQPAPEQGAEQPDQNGEVPSTEEQNTEEENDGDRTGIPRAGGPD